MKKRDKRILIIVVMILITVTITMIATYAIWATRATQSGENVIGAGCFNVDFREINERIKLTNAFPITDNEGLKKEAYTFELENNCDYAAEYNVRIEVLNTSTLSEEYIKASIDGKTPVILNTLTEASNPIASNVKKVYVIHSGILYSGEKIEHSIREWLDEFAPEASASNKLFENKVTIESVASEEVDNRLTRAILAQFGGESAIAEAPAGTFASVSSASDALMYKMEDDYGMSYYYRGAKDLLGNNLIFAEHQWKIVRINGDNSIRIIYNGVCPNNECTINSTGTSTQIKTAAWNTTNTNDAKYVGYMYGGATGTASTSREQAVTNETSSNVKTELENWYTTNIETLGYASYISDTLFCNDRRLQSEVGGTSTGSGYGTSNTNYAVNYRLSTNKTPTLMCGNKNDKFTVSDATNGNASLSKPVGLITADETSLAGGASGATNNSYYLYTNQDFWGFTPRNFHISVADVWFVHSVGALSGNSVFAPFGLRSVLNLMPDVVVISGDGSETNPYKI